MTGGCSGLTQNSPGLIPLPQARRRRRRLRRHAERPERRALHPRSQGARLQGRLLSVPADDRRRAIPGAGDHATRPTCRARRPTPSPPSSAPRRRRCSRRDTVNLTVAYSGSPTDYTLSPDDPALRRPCARSPAASTCSCSAPSCAGWRRSAGRPGRKAGAIDGQRPRGVGLSVRRRPATLADDVRSDLRRRGPDARTSRRSTTSSPIPPTGRAGWAGSTRARTASGRISTRCGPRSTIDRRRLRQLPAARATGRRARAGSTRSTGCTRRRRARGRRRRRR